MPGGQTNRFDQRQIDAREAGDVMLGRFGSNLSEMLLGSTTVSGNPVCVWTMPLTCQSARTQCAGPVQVGLTGMFYSLLKRHGMTDAKR